LAIRLFYEDSVSNCSKHYLQSLQDEFLDVSTIYWSMQKTSNEPLEKLASNEFDQIKNRIKSKMILHSFNFFQIQLELDPKCFENTIEEQTSESSQQQPESTSDIYDLTSFPELIIV